MREAQRGQGAHPSIGRHSLQDRLRGQPVPAPLALPPHERDGSKNRGETSDSQWRGDDIRRRYAHGRRGQVPSLPAPQEDTAIRLWVAADTAQAWCQRVFQARRHVSILQKRPHLAVRPGNPGYATVQSSARSGRGSGAGYGLVDRNIPAHPDHAPWCDNPITRRAGFQTEWRPPSSDWDSVHSHLIFCLEPCVQARRCECVEGRLRFLVRSCCADTRHETPHLLTEPFVFPSLRLAAYKVRFRIISPELSLQTSIPGRRRRSKFPLHIFSFLSHIPSFLYRACCAPEKQ